MQLQSQVPTKYLVGYIDVYVDKFILLSQGYLRRRNQIRSLLFHAMEQIFQPPDALEPDHLRDSISTKKLLKDNGECDNNKPILGWLVDTITLTIQLPAHRSDHLHEILRVFAPDITKDSIKSWQKLLGELRIMVLFTLGGLGLFSNL